MTETLKKLSDNIIEVTTTQEDEVLPFDRDQLLSEITECEETIVRNQRWLAELDKTS